MDGWREYVEEFAEWINLPLSFWTGEARDYYTQYVEENGYPGNAKHSQIQNRLKGRAFRKMVYDRRTEVHAPVWILSGLRKFESQRRALLTSPYSQLENATFINPLFYWTNAQVYDYMDAHNIPLAPGKQWDCKCGATVSDPAGEWREIEKKAPCLREYLESLDNPMPWAWGRFDRGAHATIKAIANGQREMWPDDGSIESFPVCAGCWRDEAAEDERLMREW